MDAFFECGCLKMQWSFSDSEKMLKIIRFLKEYGARYQVCDLSVYFWVAVNEYGRLYVVKS